MVLNLNSDWLLILFLFRIRIRIYLFSRHFEKIKIHEVKQILYHYRRAKENKKFHNATRNREGTRSLQVKRFPKKKFRRENTLEVNGAFQLLVHI